MFRFLIAISAFIVFVGCGPRYADYFPYHDDGRAKPAVAVVPLVNHSKANLCWNLEDELTDYFQYRCLDNGSLFIVPESQVSAILEKTDTPDFFGKDLAFAKSFCKTDFLVAMELIEHQVVPYEKGKISPLYPSNSGRCDDVLMMKMRVRVIDVRTPCPTVVLQEIIESNHMIPREGNRCDYIKTCWGTTAYVSTPFSIAHQRMVKDVVARLETVIYAAF